MGLRLLMGLLSQHNIACTSREFQSKDNGLETQNEMFAGCTEYTNRENTLINHVDDLPFPSHHIPIVTTIGI